jgi:gas vesicle structural protein
MSNGMPARLPASSSLVDVLDRVLDKGIVIDAYVRVCVVGIDLLTVDARIVVASIQTYFEYADLLAAHTVLAWQRRGGLHSGEPGPFASTAREVGQPPPASSPPARSSAGPP